MPEVFSPFRLLAKDKKWLVVYDKSGKGVIQPIYIHRALKH